MVGVVSGETEQSVSGWTTDTLHMYLMQQINDMRAMLNERYQTQTKAVDAAFQAQQLAMSTALTAAETAVTKALESAEKAVIKAEVAADKRFEAVNEFRAQLSDQAATFMPRTETEAALARLAERMQEIIADLGLSIPRVEAVALANRNIERIAEVMALTQLMTPRNEWAAGHERLSKQFADLETRINKIDGRSDGVTSARVLALAVIAGLGTLITAYIALTGH